MDNYNTYASELVKNVLPKEILKEMVNIFMIEASMNMGNDFSEQTLDASIGIIENKFRFLPVCYVASAFKKGSLGHFGAGRLIPRTIYGWLNEISLEYNRDMAHQANKAPDFSDAADLHKYPAGRAICLKIDWYNSGLINGNDWDNIPLKELAGMLGRGEMPISKDFGIKNT